MNVLVCACACACLYVCGIGGGGGGGGGAPEVMQSTQDRLCDEDSLFIVVGCVQLHNPAGI